MKLGTILWENFVLTTNGTVTDNIWTINLSVIVYSSCWMQSEAQESQSLKK